ncbi:hypothetical protein D9619_010878 [Psilocybe cf. subviscida]|uniref:RTA1-domain-containing protein n=1 Tax=Psilocybe cf. subviscida TaxID=2480587 RepID=A0A8H5B8V1_9AGAR|nr:hypothetical protein D9619_010878 [Psilocybe cf. subviscida]
MASFFRSKTPLLAVTALSVSVVLAAQPPSGDPYADPANDVHNPLRYIASNTLTAISFSILLITGVLQSLCMWKWGARFMLPMTIGIYTFAAGLATRFALHSNPRSTSIYIVQNLLVVLSPCAFIAADYILLGKLGTYLDTDKHLIVSSGKIAKVYIWADITTFLIQAGGGGLSATGSTRPKLAQTGSNIFLAGLILQLISFFTFCIVFVVFLHRVRMHCPDVWSKDKGLPWYNNWLTLAGALGVSCIGIIIRSIFRVIELAQGYHGFLATHEPYFYGLDTLPLFLAIAIYIPFWPGRIIGPGNENTKAFEMVPESRPYSSRQSL